MHYPKDKSHLNSGYRGESKKKKKMYDTKEPNDIIAEEEEGGTLFTLHKTCQMPIHFL